MEPLNPDEQECGITRYCYQCAKLNETSKLVCTECAGSGRPLEWGYCYVCSDKTSSQNNIFCDFCDGIENVLLDIEVKRVVNSGACPDCVKRVVKPHFDKCEQCIPPGGRCGHCGLLPPKDSGKTYEKCLDGKKKSNEKMKAKASDSGLCRRCHELPFEEGRTSLLCVKCAEERREYDRKYQERKRRGE
ncbi:hypothetical protein FPOAC2_00094 [Fusarium poae]|uniref:hypothetical protein n=1 Tax=Fusarium poae TaxID=36050 RepID=UPI001CEB297E|nr:hypothetical protein FPOAC1_000080 [Fusarium poae]KAG8674117.1 hypothetical protein FPOAC1_000080 [Fusarium poae]